MSLSSIDQLAQDSSRRITSLRIELSDRLDSELPKDVRSKICIYATGSLARLEASKFSDLDAFFYVLGSEKSCLIQPVDATRTFYNVIESAKVQKFPDFSGGGEYLHFQYLDDVVENIGSRQDDYINGLTSRMLLILEISYLYNEKEFNTAREKVIERYFIDFHDHSSDFRPIFILNNILRFWRTLCLNYEHNREWRKDDPSERAKGHLKNLKLRFSRLMICYSFIAALLQEGTALNAKQVRRIAERTPIERLKHIALGDTNLDEQIKRALDEYSWFLDAMSSPKDEVLEWISDDKRRRDAFARSKEFIETMYKISVGVAEPHGYSRYLVI